MAEVEGCDKIMKWLLFAFNLIFLLIGLAVLSLGIWIYVDFGPFLDDLAGVSWLNGPILMIVVGVVIALLSSLACWGAVRENRHCLIAFGILLVITLALEIGAGAAVYIKRDDLDDSLRNSLNASLKDYMEYRMLGENDEAIVRAWDDVQKRFECCGVDSPRDWIVPPSSCCANSNASPCLPYETGCYDKVKSEIEKNLIPVGVAVLVLAFVQIIGIIFAFCVARQIAKAVYV